MSTKDPLEDLFRDNQHGLDEKPRDLIWDRIEERLDEKPVLKKKTKVWKYAVAACAVVGISLAGFIIINLNFSHEYPESTSSIVLETEMNEEKATEILDQLEEEKTSIATTQSHSSAPEIMEEKIEKPLLSKAKTRNPPIEEIAPYDAPVMSAPAAAQMEMEMEKKLNKENQEEVLVFRSENPSKKEGNYILRNTDMENRRLGNSMEKSVLNEMVVSDSIIANQINVITSNAHLKYKLISENKDILIYENSTIEFPKQIVFNLKNGDTKVEFKGNENHKNSIESKEIQKFVNENKNWLYNTIEID